jgi:hypothetical protein
MRSVMEDSLFIEELDGPTFKSHEEYEQWWTWESPYALEYEAEEYKQLSRDQ